MWIIASIPFWLLGFAAFAIPFMALANCKDERKPFTADMVAGSALIWVIAGILLIIAAKIAS